MFGRVKPLDAILATAERKSLHRSLGAVQLTLLGIGSVIGTGIFVLTASGAQKAGPGLMLAFIIAGRLPGRITAPGTPLYFSLALKVPSSSPFMVGSFGLSSLGRKVS